MIYKIAYSNQEQYVPYYLESDRILTKEEFRAVTLGFIAEAEKRAIAANPEFWVGWHEIVLALREVLLELGSFRLVEDFPEVNLWGSGVVLTDQAATQNGIKLSQSVIEHNHKVNWRSEKRDS